MEQPATSSLLPFEKAPFRLVCFTEYDVNRDMQALASNFQYLCYGEEECPTTGRKHLQGFAYCAKAQKFGYYKKAFGNTHFEKCRGDLASNESYCKKDGHWTEYGQKPMGNGKKRTLEVFCDRLKKGDRLVDCVRDDPVTFAMYCNGLRTISGMLQTPYEHDCVRGVWIYGVPGAGKSHYARNRFDDIYIKAQNKWFDGYNGEKTILLDDFDVGKPLGHYLKIWGDKWACSGEFKGGKVHLQHHFFVITSNYSIEEMFPDDILLQDAIKRRFEIIYMGQVYK